MQSGLADSLQLACVYELTPVTYIYIYIYVYMLMINGM